jgi:hypothetical protein
MLYSGIAGRSAANSDNNKSKGNDAAGPVEEDNAMTRRLAQMTEEALESGGHAARKAVQEAGFDEELRRQLEERIASASIHFEHPTAFTQANKPSNAGKGSPDVAGAKSSTGNKAVEDTALQQLTGAHKPLISKVGSSANSGVPHFPAPIVRKGSSSGSRLANARDRSSIYSTMKDSGMSQEEHDQLLKEMKARFQPNANNLPATISGLQSLANQRIEDAIARGQFKNLPRGKVSEVDHNANSPFLDTTEYLMNKYIKRQGIAPLWIERQQEIANAARRFRSRLRNDWKRHAARLIASSGGTLEEQIRRAEQYAIVEHAAQSHKAIANISKDENDSMSEISASGQIKVRAAEAQTRTTGTLKVAEEKDRGRDAQILPFRDLEWERTERSFHKLSIDSLNKQMRSYNLEAPISAQRPYFNLDKELKACYADVAPLLGDEIRVRAQLPKAKFSVGGTMFSRGAIFQTLDPPNSTNRKGDLERKGLGLREFWRDLWAK